MKKGQWPWIKGVRELLSFCHLGALEPFIFITVSSDLLFVLVPWLFFPLSFCLFVRFFKDFIYLTERDTAREGTQAGGVGEGEAGFPLSREPDVGLNLSRRQMLND